MFFKNTSQCDTITLDSDDGILHLEFGIICSWTSSIVPYAGGGGTMKLRIFSFQEKTSPPPERSVLLIFKIVFRQEMME